MRNSSAFCCLLLALVARPAFAQQCASFQDAYPQVLLYNKCPKCIVARVDWCGAGTRDFRLNPHSGVRINSCLGSASVIDELNCGKGAFAADEAPAQQANVHGGIGIWTSNQRVTTKVLGQKDKSSSCSASNDVGDTCNASCPDGQAAQCSNATGANPPSCECR